MSDEWTGRKTPRSLRGVSSPLLCPDVRAEALVLLLCFERIDICWVGSLDACSGGSSHSFELSLVCQLLRSVRVGVEVAIVATLHGVLGVTAFSKGDVRVLANFAGHGFDQVHRSDFCHIVGIGLPQDRRKIVVGWPPSLLLNQNRLAILI